MRAGNATPYTDMAVRILCGTTTEDAAAITDAVLEDLPGNGAATDGSAYERWRAGVRSALVSKIEQRGVTP